MVTVPQIKHIDDVPPGWKLQPLLNDKRKEVVLYDMFHNGEWLGSRRSLEQVRSYIDWVERGRPPGTGVQVGRQ